MASWRNTFGRLVRLTLIGSSLSVGWPASATGPFMIMFDSGTASLSARAATTLDYAYDWLRSFGEPAFFLECSADRLGPPEANRRLARERGEAVRAALMRRGYPGRLIRILALGEDRPLIETADGVAEPQNRFCMIFLEDGQIALA